jgi:peptidoglycan hydrolase-like protein with peptidoglycan-binding domain
MTSWKSTLAVALAGALLTAPVYAQGTGGAGGGGTGGGSGTGGGMTTGSPPASRPSGEGTTPSPAPPRPGSMKSPDSTKSSDSMKGSDAMKSDSGKMDKSSMGRGGNRDQVKAVQQALKDKGHDPGDPDGMMGPRTQAALRDFQKAQGLKETGRLDTETMAKLGVDAKSSSVDTGSGSASPATGRESKGSRQTPGASTTTPAETGKDAAGTKK